MFIFRFIRRVISFILLLIIVVPLYVAGSIWYSARNSVAVKSDVILVMGAAQFDGRPSDILQSRLKESLQIYKSGLAPRIYTIGSGAPGDRFTEAGAGRTWLISNGVPRRAITAIPQGRDTFQSIEALTKGVKKLDIKDIIIVTDPYHCLRSMTMANDQGFVATCSPTRVGIASLEKAGFRYLVREAGAYLAYVTLGRRGIHISDHVA
ncbi:MAG: YdcF family protein [Actinobacteria bacterium]|nr:YdcF family protein [Actinomycetota bacterium]